MTRIRLIRECDYRRTRWANDGGWTTEIARDPADGSTPFRWRVSIANIESDGPFSNFPGVIRDLLLLEGNGIELEIDGESPSRLTHHLAHIRFDGGARVNCRLLDGPTRDFNVMVRDDAIHADVTTHVLGANGMTLDAGSNATSLVHVISGPAVVRIGDKQVTIARHETLHIDSTGGQPELLQLCGIAQVIVVQFKPNG